MRRGSMMVLALLAATTALTALPGPVGAQQRNLPGALFGAITRPLGAILGGPRHYGRRHYSRRTARSRAPAAAQSRPPAAAAVVSTAAAGAAVAGTAAVAAAASESPAATKPAFAEAQSDPSAGAPTSPQPVEAAAPPAAPEKTSAAKPTPAAKDPSPAARQTPAASSQDSFAAASKSTPIPAPAQPVAATATTPASPASPAPSGTATAPAAPSPAAASTAPDAGARTATAATPAPASTAAAPAVTPPVAARTPSQRNAGLARPAEQSPTPSTANQPPRGSNRLGFAGPLAWPTAFEDVVGFTLWPGEYGERLRGHGIGDVMSAVMVPASTLLAQIRPSVAMARTDGKADTPARSGGICSIDPSSEEWPAAQIERSLQLNAAQRDALAQFKTAFRDAGASIKSACRDEAAVPPVERLRAMQSTLWAIHDAVIGLRSPLAKFYDSLSEEQRQKFAAPASAQADPRSMTPAAIAKLCGAPQSNEGQARQAERHLNLDKAQRGSLDAFQKKSAEMGQFLMASCLKPVASTPVERIDAAADRLTALIFAASSVNLALNDFYNQLNDEQKAKFNTAVR